MFFLKTQNLLLFWGFLLLGGPKVGVVSVVQVFPKVPLHVSSFEVKVDFVLVTEGHFWSERLLYSFILKAQMFLFILNEAHSTSFLFMYLGMLMEGVIVLPSKVFSLDLQLVSSLEVETTPIEVEHSSIEVKVVIVVLVGISFLFCLTLSRWCLCGQKSEDFGGWGSRIFFSYIGELPPIEVEVGLVLVGYCCKKANELQYFIVLPNSPIEMGIGVLLALLFRGLMVFYTIIFIIFLGSWVSSLSVWLVDAWLIQAVSLFN